jgi:ABC-2 type transport system ATP-binding protein
MKDTIRRRAGQGAAILISSHLLHLLEEICSHVLIVQNGRKIVDGPLDEVVRRFAGQAGELNLEEVFFRATGADNTPPFPDDRLNPPALP